MKKTHDILKRISMLMLSGIVALTTCVTSPFLASADTVIDTPEDRYYLDLGMTVCECFGGTKWTEDNVWGSTEPITSTYHLTFNKGADVVDMKLADYKPYTFYSSSSEFESHYSEFARNLPDTYAGTAQKFEANYRPYCATNITALSATMNGQSVTINHKALLKTSSGYEVCAETENNGGDAVRGKIYELLGGWNSQTGKWRIEEDQKKLYDSIEAAISHVENGGKTNGKSDTQRKCYIVFKPTLVHYIVTVRTTFANGNIEARLTAPTKVKVGQSLTVSDATIVASDTRYESGTLSRKVGSGSFTTLATWQGPGRNGENSGQSLTETFSEVGTVTYRLDVRANSGKTSTYETSVVIESAESKDYGMDFGWSVYPTTTYEGHPVVVADLSDFSETVTKIDEDGKETTETKWYDIYSRGSHSYETTATDYTQTRIDKGNTEFRFWTEGNYSITVEEHFHGLYDGATENVKVLKTPTIIDSLSGQQKQNRKQVLSADIALNPRYPLSDWEMIIKDEGTGETVTLNPSRTKVNSTNIKTREVSVTTDVDGCFSHIKVEFLTKNPKEGQGANADGTQPYSYSIFVKDSRGRTERVNKNFSVAPDKAPVAAIETEDNFIREQCSNTASISVKDVSSTDGDNYERYWSYAAADPKTEAFGAYTEITSGSLGYTDSSFGSGQNIAFAKEGVGRVNVKLVVKDKIPANETLAEFLVPSDYLSSEAIAATTVVNIAPTVSLEPIEAVNAKVYVYGNLGTDGGAVAGVMESLRALKNDLLPEGIMLDAEDISEGNVVGTPSGYQSNSSADGAKRIFQKIDPYMPYTYDSGAEGRTFWEDGYYSADGECLYVLNPNFYITQAETGALYAKYGYTFPFTVAAYNLRNSSVKWQTTVTQSLWGSSSIDLGGPVPYNDSEYFLLRTGDSTLVFQKSNGAYLTTFPFVMGEYAWGKNGNLYTLKSDGLYKIDRNGAVSMLFGGNLLSNPKVLGEKLWILSGANGELRLIKFDFESETSEVSRFVYQYSFSQSSLECLGIDSDGKVAVSDKGTVYVYEDVAALPIFISDSFSAEYVKTFAVNNANDTLRYVGVGGYTDGSGGVNRFATVYDIYSGKKLSYNCTSSYNNNDYGAESVFPPDFKRLLAAWDYGNGIVEIATGYPNTLLVYKAPSFGIKRPLPASLSFDFANTPADNVTSSVGDFAGSPFVGLPNIVTSGRLMDGYYIGAVNSSSHTPEDGDRGIFVVTLPKTSGELENAAVSKNVAEKETSKTDKAYVLSVAELADNVKKKAESLGYSLLRGLENAAERIKTLLRRQETATNSILVTASSGTQSTLSRQIKLKPGKEYYYEYSVAETGNGAESADNLSVGENIRKFKAENGLSYLNENSGYVVTGAETEDYSGELNPFFKYQSGEREDDKWKVYGSGKDKHGGTWGVSGTFNFTVPEGKKAVLVVDYLVKGSDMRNYYDFPYLSASFDSEVLPGAAERNTVTVPQLIESGTHTFQVYSYVTGSSSYYCGSVCFTKINLYFVEKGANISAGSFGGRGSVSDANGLKTVSGNFKTDFSVLNYASQNGAAVTATSGATGFGEGITKYFDVTYNGEGRWTEGRKDDRVTYYSNSWTLSLKPEYEVTNVVGLEGTINFSGTYTELRCTKTSDRSWYISWVSIMKNRIQGYPTFSFFMTAIKPGQVNTKLTEGKYFDEGNGFLQVEDRTFDGTTTLTLSSSAPTWYLTSFSLYYLENGKKVYVINEEQMGKDKLKNWEVSGGTKSFAVYSAEPVEEDAALIYKKGEYVAQKVNYSDYESDPSKTGYWIYAHEPYNDGLNAKAGIVLNDDEEVISVGGTSVAPGSLTIEQAAERLRSSGSSSYILTEPINRFYEDGKYHALYYAYDDTSRGVTPGGNPNYDKASNMAEFVFYIIGEAASAPYIKSIKTSPAVVIEDENAKILTEVGDAEGDTLSLTVELFRDSERILRQKWTGLTPNAAGEYPIKTTNNFTCDAGAYTVIATVRDATGVGAGTYQFKVGEGSKIVSGEVNHTATWLKNLNKYNTQVDSSKKRAVTDFWAGENLVCHLEAKGLQRATVEIVGNSVSKIELKNTSGTTKGLVSWDGTIPGAKLLETYQAKKTKVTVRFKGYTKSGKELTLDKVITIDDLNKYWLLHG